MPLEHNTVRFVDNFSAGTRGSASAEYFLDHEYAVIFMHRQKSLEPFTRHFTGQQFFDMLDVAETDSESGTPSIFGKTFIQFMPKDKCSNCVYVSYSGTVCILSPSKLMLTLIYPFYLFSQ